ncbi:MAG: alkaline phosphatase family protein [Terriglobales bacterium]|jgi:phospholipase C
MKRSAQVLLLAALLGTVAQAQFPSQIQHVIIVFQENRTPDNLFQGLRGLKGSNGVKYDIQNYWVESTGTHKLLAPVGLATNFDLSHAHSAFVSESTAPSTALVPGCSGTAEAEIFGCAASTWNQFMYVDNAQELTSTNLYGKKIVTHILDPYINMAQRWGWANYMYQTNQGPSYPAHQFIFGGTSAPSAQDDSQGTFVSENFSPQSAFAGCLADTTAMNFLIDSSGTETPYGGVLGDFCYNRNTMATLLDNNQPTPVTWRYYAPAAGSIWTAPNSITAICQPNSGFTACDGSEWATNVIFPFTASYGAVPFLNDLQNCQLPAVSWVIPDGRWSDHANANKGLGPSYVAGIVNAVGGFNNSCGYWANTAIVLTWDDWGGWYDHAAPWTLAPPYNNYNYGFRVPLIVISAYTKPGLVSTVQPEDFGSVLNMLQGIFFGPTHERQLGFADARSSNDLREYFTETTQQPYGATIPAVEDINYFLNLPAPQNIQNQAVAPDND